MPKLLNEWKKISRAVSVVSGSTKDTKLACEVVTEITQALSNNDSVAYVLAVVRLIQLKIKSPLHFSKIKNLLVSQYQAYQYIIDEKFNNAGVLSRTELEEVHNSCLATMLLWPKISGHISDSYAFKMARLNSKFKSCLEKPAKKTHYHWV